MKNKTKKINNIFIKMMVYSLIAQLFILGFLIIFVRNYINHNQLNSSSDDLLIKDQYTIDKIGQYVLLDSKYALDLELHNLGDMRKLDSIKFVHKLKIEKLGNECTLLKSNQFRLCENQNGSYLGITSILGNNKILGYVLAIKKYSPVFPSPARYDLLLILLSVIGIFIINIGFLFLPLKKKIENNTKYLINFISPKNSLDDMLSRINIEEYKTVALKFIEERTEIKRLQKEKSYYEARKNIAEQVAHDIRSPLAAINTALIGMESIQDNRWIMIKNAFQRINDIANNLLYSIRKNVENPLDCVAEHNSTAELIYLIIDNIVSEKKYEYFETKAVIKMSISNAAYSCFSKIDTSSFMRVLSNLLNNSVEAINYNGNVHISLSCDNEYIEISIEDDGCGIPTEVIQNITDHGFSFGKENGAGIGLSYAKEYIEKINGLLIITSEMNVGTTVTIKLLRAESPEWFHSQLNIHHDSCIVILDDDQSIHDAWNERLKISPDIRVVNFLAYSDITKEKVSDLNPDVYLIDYDLLSENNSGLDLIEELSLNRNAFLVTSCFENPGIRSRCKNMDVKIIPKYYIPYIPIIISNKKTNNDNTFVLIDNDENMRITWAFAAEEAGVNLQVFSHPDEFTSEMNNHDKHTVIYIDSNLDTEIPGEIYAKELYKNGFKDIHLSTGYPPDKFKSVFWIKSVVGKIPPFNRDGGLNL